MNPLARTLTTLLLTCLPLLAHASNAETLIARHDWHQAARAVLLEAGQEKNIDSSLPLAQARAGFVDDALNTIAGLYAGSQPYRLVEVAELPQVSAARREALLGQALDIARQQAERDSTASTGAFMWLALHYCGAGDETQARALLALALEYAHKLDSYDRMIYAMQRSPQHTRSWMISPVTQALARDRENAAFNWLGLAELALKMGDKTQALGFVDQGIEATGQLRDSRNGYVLSQLNLLALKAGRASLPEPLTPYLNMTRLAITGAPDQAYELLVAAPQDGNTHYGARLWPKLIEDASQRNDLPTARYFAERPIEQSALEQASAWQQVAQLQWQAHQDFSASYRHAFQALEPAAGTPRSLEDISTLAKLLDLARQAGLKQPEPALLDQAVAMIDHLPADSPSDQIRARLQLLPWLWRQGTRDLATTQALTAYRDLSGYRDSSAATRAELLTEMGVVFSEVAAPSPGVRTPAPAPAKP